MGYSNSRGQSGIEMVLCMLLLTSLVILSFEFSAFAGHILPTVQLSKEKR
jgi:hypothetical protein